MDKLTVLFDGACSICRASADWLEHAPQEVPLELCDATSPQAQERFGAIPWLGAELVVVSGDGRVWAGPAAFLVTGWALSRWRWLANVAMSPLALPLALALFEWVTAHRGALAPLVGGRDCEDGHCLVKHTPRRAMLYAYR